MIQRVLRSLGLGSSSSESPPSSGETTSSGMTVAGSKRRLQPENKEDHNLIGTPCKQRKLLSSPVCHTDVHHSTRLQSVTDWLVWMVQRPLQNHYVNSLMSFFVGDSESRRQDDTFSRDKILTSASETCHVPTTSKAEQNQLSNQGIMDNTTEIKRRPLSKLHLQRSALPQNASPDRWHTLPKGSRMLKGSEEKLLHKDDCFPSRSPFESRTSIEPMCNGTKTRPSSTYTALSHGKRTLKDLNEEYFTQSNCIDQSDSNKESSKDFLHMPSLSSHRIFGTHNTYSKSTATQSIRLREKEQYKLLLQQFTSEPVSLRPEQLSTSHASTSSFSSSRKCEEDSSSHSIKSKPAFQRETLNNNSREKLIHSIADADRKGQCSFSSTFVRPSERTRQGYWPVPRPATCPDVSDTSLSALDDVVFVGNKVYTEAKRKVVPSPAKHSSHSNHGIFKRSTTWKASAETSGESDDCIVIGHKEAPKLKKLSGSNKFPSFELFSPEWLEDLKQSLKTHVEEQKKSIEEQDQETRFFQEQRKSRYALLNKQVQARLGVRGYTALRESLADYFGEQEEEEDISQDFPELTPEMEAVVEDALKPTPADEVLSEGFRLSVARRDMETLAGLNWLNDEVINFYMNLLVERGKLDNFPSTYAFNTFFYPKLLSTGHGALKRWTRKIDVFSYDYLLVPIHLGMHWCLAVVDFRKKCIQYYDSMGGHNMECLHALRCYLEEESRDKKKQVFDTSDWEMETVKGIPQQMNGSDCGMFCCKYAEYVTRGAKITFTQAHMPYFRQRMVYEILTKKLL